MNESETNKVRAEGCIFCRIADGELPASFLYEDDDIMVIENIKPVAKVHVLVIPKNHIVLNEAEHCEEIMGRLVCMAREAAEEKGIKESGYRTIINTGHDAQADFDHLHLHVIGREKLNSQL